MFKKLFRTRPKVNNTPSCNYRSGVVGSPASESEIKAAEDTIGFVFPEQIRDLYRSHNGLDTQHDPVRIPGFMPLDLVVAMHTPDNSGWLAASWLRFGYVAFWEDYESNYMAVRVARPGQGMVAIIQHDGACFAPRYRTIISFLDRVEAAAVDGTEWFDWDTDYPLPSNADDMEASAREFFWGKADACEKEDTLNWFEMGAHLVPKHKIELIVPYLDSADCGVQSKATALIARAAPPDAMDHMKRMVMHGQHYARYAAIRGITQLAGYEGLNILEALAPDVPPEIQKYIKQHVAFIHRSVKRGLDPFVQNKIL